MVNKKKVKNEWGVEMSDSEGTYPLFEQLFFLKWRVLRRICEE